MKRCVIRLFLLTLCLCNLENISAQKSFWMLAGQSNAAGTGDRRTSLKYADPACQEYSWHGDSLKVLQDPVGETDEYFGKANTGSIAPSFAYHLHKLTGDSIVMVVAGRGGSSCGVNGETIYGTWALEGKLSVYKPCIDKATMAQKKVKRSLDGIIWMQGERDSNSINDGKQTPEEYEKALKNLINRFRIDLKNANLPIYIVLTGQYVNFPKAGYMEVRRIQRKVAKEVPHVHLVAVDPWFFPEREMMTDDIHYSQEAYNYMGKIIAQQIVETK